MQIPKKSMSILFSERKRYNFKSKIKHPSKISLRYSTPNFKSIFIKTATNIHRECRRYFQVQLGFNQLMVISILTTDLVCKMELQRKQNFSILSLKNLANKSNSIINSTIVQQSEVLVRCTQLVAMKMDVFML